MALQFVSMVNANDILMEHVGSSLGDFREPDNLLPHEAGCGKKLMIEVRPFDSLHTSLVDVGKLHGKGCSLDLVQARVDAHRLVIVSGALPVDPKHLDLFGELFSLRRYQTPVSYAAQILTGGEGEAA